jgi:SAM-dependent methyltransferase
LFEAIDENRRCAGTFTYLRCAGCGLITNATPPLNMQDYYPGEYYAIPTTRSLERLASRENCKISAIRRFVTRGRLLEIGPAFGAFALRAKQEGFEVTCIERDARCRDFLESTVGVHAIGSSDPAAAVAQLPSFDVIALWQVIEHLDGPLALLDSLAARLTAGGILALSTPNPESFQFARMGNRWPHVDAPRHLHLLPARLLVERMQAHGFEMCLLDSNDADAKSWNRFGWQRLIMNRFRGPLGTALGIAAGGLLSLLFQPLESAAMRGSTYTLVMRKEAA